ncbi:hypothetical protein GCM10027447_17370 [Glycomyces halotolerans]
MPSPKTSGLRIAAAGTAAAALTLAAGAPGFAQTDFEYVDVWFNLVDTNDRVEVLEYEGQEAYIAVEGPDPLAGDVIEVTYDFSHHPGIIELRPDHDERCEISNHVLTCVDDGSSGLAGTFFDLDLGLGDQGAPGDVAYYFFTVTVNGQEETDGEGQIQVSEDFDIGEEDGPALPDDFPVGDIEEAGDAYGFAFLNQVIEGAHGGRTVTATPQFRIESESDLGEDRAATALFFSHSVSLNAWFDEEEPTGHYTENIRAVADHDNCTEWPGGVLCVIEDFAPQVGATYTPSADTPVQYTVDNETSDVDLGAYYTAWDINEATMDLFRRSVVTGTDDQFGLVEADEEIDDRYFSRHYGMLFFGAENGYGDVEPTDPAESEETEDAASGGLQKTGGSSIVMVSAASAAIAAGAVVFFVLRRRKVVQNWE